MKRKEWLSSHILLQIHPKKLGGHLGRTITVAIEIWLEEQGYQVNIL